MIDTHSHILPGVDDGARTISDSVDIIRELADQGVTDIIATPHYICETNFMSPRKTNGELLKELKKLLSAAEINVNLYLGNEIYIDNKILDLLKAKLVSPLAGSKYLLIEMPLDEEFPSYLDYFEELIASGYQVVLAHPERYQIIQKDYELIKELHDTGVLFQCNVGSFVGKYGKKAAKTVKKLAKDKLIFMLGSDTHRSGGKPYFSLAGKKLKRYFTDQELKRILETNPRKIINHK